MERGIHVYTQKPLTHNIWQCRTLVKAKERYKVVTQMGNQGHAGDGIRQSVEAVRAGVIGDVSEVFCRNDGPEMGGDHFANPATMPPPSSPVPDGLAWDLWLGPAAKRDFYADYLPKKWRAFYDFGSGHARRLRLPHASTPRCGRSISIRPPWSSALRREKSLDGVIPTASHIKFHFPAKGDRGPVMLDWFDGPQDWTKVGRIDKFGAEHAAHLGRACWMVGTKGMLGCGTHAGAPLILPETCARSGRQSPRRKPSRASRAGRSASGCARSRAKARNRDRTSTTPPSSPRSSC